MTVFDDSFIVLLIVLLLGVILSDAYVLKETRELLFSRGVEPAETESTKTDGGALIMHTWIIENSKGHIVRIRARDIGDIPAGFGFDGEIFDTVKAERVDE